MSATFIQPYLFFDGRCEEALAFYQKALGAEVEVLMRYSDSPEPPPPGMIPPGYESKVMHTCFRVGNTHIMASDGCGDTAPFAGFSLSLGVATEAEADHAFQALIIEGGEIIMPLAKTFWSPRFGMLKDKFGVSWMINTHSVETPQSPKRGKSAKPAPAKKRAKKSAAKKG
jgi:PhnB protein